MAYILSGETLKDKNPTVVFTSGGENTSFPFSNVWSGITSKGFKSNSGTSPVVILQGVGGQFDAIGIYGTSGDDSGYTVTVHYSPNANVSSASDSSWVQWLGDKAGSNTTGGAVSQLTVDQNRSSNLLISHAKNTMQCIKLTFLNFSTTDVLNHVQVGNTAEIDISAPYNPPLFKVQKQTMRRNNKGLPLGSELIDEPVKLKLNIRNQTEAQMKALATQTFVNELYKNPFMLATSYDLTSETKKFAYLCTLDGTINQPRYRTSTHMEWIINAVGYV